jgi:hypothetical protein
MTIGHSFCNDPVISAGNGRLGSCLQGDTALCLHPRRNSSSVLMWRLAIVCARERPEALDIRCNSGEQGGTNTRWIPSGSTNVGLLCHSAPSGYQDDTPIMASADCPCKVCQRDGENLDANRWKEQKVVFPPTQDKRNRTHTAIGNGAGRANWTVSFP